MLLQNNPINFNKTRHKVGIQAQVCKNEGYAYFKLRHKMILILTLNRGTCTVMVKYMLLF